MRSPPLRNAEAGGSAFTGYRRSRSTTRSWLLDDGPVNPEHLERGGILPPLVFSNSYRALPALGHRFIRPGASTFIGPVVPLFSRPARIFAGHCYGALGQGWCAGAAVWKASRECRRELGDNHPAWLSYGVQGYGKLALAVPLGPGMPGDQLDQFLMDQAVGRHQLRPAGHVVVPL